MKFKEEQKALKISYKYIDDEQDLDAMETEREKKQQADAHDLLILKMKRSRSRSLVPTLLNHYHNIILTSMK